MKILILDNAQKEFDKFPNAVQVKFYTLFNELLLGYKLDESKFKKLTNNDLFEFRVKHDSNIYRGIGGNVSPNFLITIFFKKKTRKIPTKELRNALTRYINYKLNYFNEKISKR